MEWAKGVIESHPEHRVIIVTHDYIGATTNLTLNGNKIWDNLAGQYENVVLVLAGHVSWDNIEVRQSEGVHGNTVTQMLINPQRIDLLLSGVGIVTMFYFSDNGSLVDVEHYSPEWDRYFKNINQMQIDLESDRFKDTVIKAPVIADTPIATPDPIPESNNKMWIAISVSVAVIVVSAVSVPLLIKKSRKRRVKKLFESEEQ